ncbi:MAG: hypothetical protein IJH67_01265 [Thermoguttaceae bacterium]|nr:hypothetical protein [Thermoguttaceae bacterium]
MEGGNGVRAANVVTLPLKPRRRFNISIRGFNPQKKEQIKQTSSITLFILPSIGGQDKKILKRLGSRANPSASLFRGRLYSQKEKINRHFNSIFFKI